MKSKNNKTPTHDIFSELFDSFFQLLLVIGSDFFKGVVNVVTSLTKSQFERTKMKHPSNKLIQNTEIIIDKISRKSDDEITNIDLSRSTSTDSESAIGFDIKNRKDFTFKDYNSNVPLSVIIGPPGWGKTVLLLNLIDRDLANDTPYIVFDPKASAKSKEIFQKITKRRGREALIFDNESGLRLNPLKGLNPTQVVESIYRAFPNYHEYYGPRSKSLLVDIVRMQNAVGRITSLPNIYKDLEDIAKSDKAIKMETQGLASNLKLVLASEFGKLFEDRGDALSISDIREQGKCLYIPLPSLTYNQLAQSMAKIFISELMNHSYEAMNTKNFKHNISVYIDEAGDFLFRDFKSLPAQCREAGVNLTIATQSISDLNEVSDNFLNQIKTYTGNFWIFRVADPENAEKMARYLGTKTVKKETKQILDGVDSGSVSERETESFIVHTNTLKNLPKYKALLKVGTEKIPRLINIRNIESVFGLDTDFKSSDSESEFLKMTKKQEEHFMDMFLS